MFVAMGMLAIVSIVNSFDTDTVAAFLRSLAHRDVSIGHTHELRHSAHLVHRTEFRRGRLRQNTPRHVRHRTLFAHSWSRSHAIGLLLAAEPLMRVFTTEREVIEVGCGYLRVLGLSFWIFSLMMCFMGALRGMGNTVAPMIITLFSLWIVKIPVAYMLSERFGQTGIWAASAFSLGLWEPYVRLSRSI